MASVIITASTAASTAWPAAFGFGTRLVHCECTAANVLPIQGGNRRFCFSVIRHLDEAETARTPGIAVRNHRHTFHGAVRFKKLAEL
jgi:hypothetical protein